MLVIVAVVVVLVIVERGEGDGDCGRVAGDCAHRDCLAGVAMLPKVEGDRDVCGG
jgi:hypothetical protein